jgi:hypothetical protein
MLLTYFFRGGEGRCQHAHHLDVFPGDGDGVDDEDGVSMLTIVMVVTTTTMMTTTTITTTMTREDDGDDDATNDGR